VPCGRCAPNRSTAATVMSTLKNRLMSHFDDGGLGSQTAPALTVAFSSKAPPGFPVVRCGAVAGCSIPQAAIQLWMTAPRSVSGLGGAFFFCALHEPRGEEAGDPAPYAPIVRLGMVCPRGARPRLVQPAQVVLRVPAARQCLASICCDQPFESFLRDGLAGGAVPCVDGDTSAAGPSRRRGSAGPPACEPRAAWCEPRPA